jgi:tetratricopeptide (TPR) repeat protein
MSKKRKRAGRRGPRSLGPKRSQPIWRTFRYQLPPLPKNITQEAERRHRQLSPFRLEEELEQLFQAGMERFEVEDYQGALTQLLLCQALLPAGRRSQPLLFNIGQCYASLNNYEQARLYLEAAAALKPKDPDPYFPLAQIALQEGRYEACIALSERGRRLLGPKTRDPKGLSNLAHAYHELGQIDQSLAVLHQALRLDPTWAPAHQGLGACYEDKLELGRALYHYRQAARLAPVDPGSHDNVQRLESGHFLAQLDPNDPAQVARLATLEKDPEKLGEQIRREADRLAARE